VTLREIDVCSDSNGSGHLHISNGSGHLHIFQCPGCNEISLGSLKHTPAVN
jgi:hypothetical protein